MFQFFLDGVLLPVAPSILNTSINNLNSTINLLNESQINLVKSAGLSSFKFDALIPHTSYSFARYSSGFLSAEFFLDHFFSLKQSSSPFQFIVIRTFENSAQFHSTNVKVTLEDYSIVEDASNNSDIVVSFHLKEYRDYSTKTCNISSAFDEYSSATSSYSVASSTPTRETSNSPAPASATSYTVVSGDCLWNIAKHFYGDGNKYSIIYNANSSIIANPNLIYPGQVLTIPAI